MSKRENVLAVRLTETERQAIEALARARKIPASTLVRVRLLLEAEQAGFVSNTPAVWESKEWTGG